jgi:hypothetical protein
LIMMDSRHPLAELGQAARDLKYPQLAFWLNRHYGCAHGYTVIYYRMTGSSCQHALFGERHPSYCKLAAIGETLSRGFRVVAFLDSDCFVQPHIAQPLPLLQLLSDARGAGDAALHEPLPSCFFAWDRPYSHGPNAGMMVWRNTEAARLLLSAWWHLDGGPYHTQHDYEQHALQWRLVHLTKFRGALETLLLQTMDNSMSRVAGYHAPIAHVDHTRPALRYWMLALSTVEVWLRRLRDTRDEPSARVHEPSTGTPSSHLRSEAFRSKSRSGDGLKKVNASDNVEVKGPRRRGHSR